MLKNCEKLLKKYSRYLFRYLPSKFSGAVGSSQMQKSAIKRYKMLSNALKNPKCFLHVAVVKNINKVVVNNNLSQEASGFLVFIYNKFKLM